MAWLQAFMAIDGKQMATLGIPQMAGSSTKAPYDILGDTMRGTRGLMLDKFRRPDKVKAAMERLAPLAIDWALRSADATRNPLVFIPIHKGADGFMSDADYRELYWPTFKTVLLGLIALLTFKVPLLTVSVLLSVAPLIVPPAEVTAPANVPPLSVPPASAIGVLTEFVEALSLTPLLTVMVPLRPAPLK